jgi:hypothetical protein
MKEVPLVRGAGSPCASISEALHVDGAGASYVVRVVARYLEEPGLGKWREPMLINRKESVVPYREEL